MVVIYNQLLAREFAGRLPEPATRYLGFSEEGALRMQDLLTGLRNYWQASERGEDQRTMVRCDDTVRNALSRMRFRPAQIGKINVSQVVQQAFVFKLNR